MRTQDEIWEQIERADGHVEQGLAQWPGMSYEQGVTNALRWALGEDDTPPMEDED